MTTNVPVINFPYLPPLPLTNVTPFTYRDGLTYLQTLSELRDTIIRVVEGQVELDEKINSALQNVNNLVGQIESLTVEILTTIRTTGDEYLPRMEELYSLHTALAAELSPIFEIEQNLANEVQNRIADVEAERDARVQADADLLSTLADVSTDVDNVGTRVTGLEQRLLSYYGAVGDGEADDTQAVQNYLNAGYRTLDGRTYRLTDTLTVSGKHVGLEGNGTVLVVDSQVKREAAIHVVGDYATVHGFTITSNHENMDAFLASGGRGEVAHGIRVDGMYAVINDNAVSHIFSYNNIAGIRVDGRGGSIVSGNRVSDIEALGSEQGQDGTAYARGISIQFAGAASQATTVSGNTIERITGQGSAGINTLHSDTATRPFPNGHVNIMGNSINDIDRRHIKVQSSNVTIKDNVIRDTRTNTPIAPASVIDCIDSQRIVIDSNVIERTDLTNMIMVHKELSAVNLGFIRITNNTIEAKGNQELIGIYVGSCNQIYVNNNTIIGGKDGIRIGSCENGTVVGNVIGYQTANGVAALTTTSCRSLACANNVDTSPYRDGSPFRFDGDFITTANNISRA